MKLQQQRKASSALYLLVINAQPNYVQRLFLGYPLVGGEYVAYLPICYANTFI